MNTLKRYFLSEKCLPSQHMNNCANCDVSNNSAVSNKSMFAYFKNINRRNVFSNSDSNFKSVIINNALLRFNNSKLSLTQTSRPTKTSRWAKNQRSLHCLVRFNPRRNRRVPTSSWRPSPKAHRLPRLNRHRPRRIRSYPHSPFPPH